VQLSGCMSQIGSNLQFSQLQHHDQVLLTNYWNGRGKKYGEIWSAELWFDHFMVIKQFKCNLLLM
jgi:hypothetical protein